MNSKKSGTIFIVLMIALIAYGFGSFANAFDLGGNSMVNLIPSNIISFNQQQITQTNDPSFQPVYLIEHILITNNTNKTNETSNSTYIDNSGDQNNTNQDNNQ
jgi:hypothetical protein